MFAETARSSSSEHRLGLAGYRQAALISARDYATLYSPRILALTLLPRVLLQVAFVSYLGYLLALSGAAAPLSAMGPVLSLVVHVLPLTNGLLAVRSLINGEAWLGSALAELATGVGWIAVATVLLIRQDRRARRLGTDELL